MRLRAFGQRGLAIAPGSSLRLARAIQFSTRYFERDRYSCVSVLIVIVSPSATKCGTLMTIPVSSVAGLSVLFTDAVFMQGSGRTTLSATVFGSVTLSGVVS